MENNGYIFKVGELLNADQGTRIHYSLSESEPLIIDNKIEFKPPLKAEVTFMKMEDAIHVNIENFIVALNVDCSKCLARFTYKINIPQAERVYYFNKQTGYDMDDIDTFYVDMKKFQIDLAEFLRQEIILHFPMVPVCLKSCKGLCAHCGKNLNKGTCKCKDEEQSQKPFKDLKKLLKTFKK